MNNRVAFRFIEQEDLFQSLREVSSFRYKQRLFQIGLNVVNEMYT